MFINGHGERSSIPGRVIRKTLKMVLDTSLLNTQPYVSRVKWSNQGKGVAPSPTPRCSSYWKGRLWVTFDYDHLLFLGIPLLYFKQLYGSYIRFLLIMKTDPLVEWIVCSPMSPKTGVQSQVESYQRLEKWYLILYWLTLSIISYV